jgi:membrane fusion protein, heavy metal efflux system
MSQRITIAILILCSGSPGSVVAAQPLGCLIEPDRVTEVGSPVVGVVDKILVERGDFVAEGAPIAVLHSEVERAALRVAESKAVAAADIEAAIADLGFARQRRERAEDLFSKKFIARQALDQAQTEASIAQQKLAEAREQQGIWKRELALAQARVAERTVHSPIEGVIVERYVSAGERVEEKAIVRIARINPLRVEVVLPASFYGKVSVNDIVSVLPELPQATRLDARVTLVDRVIDAASNTLRVRLEIPNPDNSVPPGVRCRADFGSKDTPAAARLHPSPAR